LKNNSIVVPKIPAIKSPKSSLIVKLTAAEKPINDHRKGIKITIHGILLTEKSKIPKVKITVGHGKPNVGVLG
jgi:hypothetical protein